MRRGKRGSGGHPRSGQGTPETYFSSGGGSVVNIEKAQKPHARRGARTIDPQTRGGAYVDVTLLSILYGLYYVISEQWDRFQPSCVTDQHISFYMSCHVSKVPVLTCAASGYTARLWGYTVNRKWNPGP